MIARTNALLPLTPTADHTGKEGYAVSAAGALMASATAVPYAVIVEGQPTTGKDTVAPFAGGVAGVIKVKLHTTPGTVNRGTRLISHTDGTFKADGGSGARVQCAEAQETGAAGELIEAVLITPLVLS